MGFSQKLAMRQGQSLVMTPQLSQSIKLLTLSNIELAEFVEGELERNPFLEAGTKEAAVRDDVQPPSTEKTDGPVSDLTQNTELETSAKGLSENLGTEIENVYPDEPDYRISVSENAKTREEHDFRTASGGLQLSSQNSAHDTPVADYTAQTETLRDTLTAQLTISGANATILSITHDMIDNLDEAGYFRGELDEVADRLACSNEEVQTALELLQTLEPAGIGARNLSECLKLQLRELNRLDPGIESVLDNLDLLAKRDFAALQKISGLDTEDLHDILMEVQTLDPKPGTAYESSPVQHVAPDVFVREAQDGSWQIELNSETLPRVLINNSYVTEIGKNSSDAESRAFVSDCLQSANWLTKSLDQRAQTILKVSKEIIKQQDAFLVHGVRHLRPLTLKMVADEIEMHESSVSRVTSNKYMMTPRGLFELKYFFTTGITGSTGEDDHSSESVRDHIRSLVNNETANAVLSDDAIVGSLRSEGIEIARRTVAKYRDAMHIPSSVQRRREKRALQKSG